MNKQTKALKMAIEVNISTEEIQNETLAFNHPLLAEGWFVSKLKKAGIPVKGILLFNGIESGILSRTNNFDGSISFKWVSA